VAGAEEVAVEVAMAVCGVAGQEAVGGVLATAGRTNAAFCSVFNVFFFTCPPLADHKQGDGFFFFHFHTRFYSEKIFRVFLLEIHNKKSKICKLPVSVL
jgi:hypothetical protein